MLFTKNQVKGLTWVVMDGHDAWLAECAKIGYTPAARHYEEGTRTSQDAADQLGCEVAHIAKSIVFAGKDGAVVVITSGANRVDRKKKLKRLNWFNPIEIQKWKTTLFAKICIPIKIIQKCNICKK